MRNLKTWIFVILVEICSILAGQADTNVTNAPVQADPQTLWSELGFYGSPVTPAPEPKVIDYLNFDRQNCSGEVNGILKLSEKFRQHAASSTALIPEMIAGGDLSKLHKYLYETIGAANPCFDAVAKAYILESQLITNPTWPMTLRSGDRARIANYVPNSPAEFVLTAAMLNSGRIKVLTPELRNQLGSGWSEQVSHPRKLTSPYRLRGAFSCTDSTIYIDPEIPPINLAANLNHELDHFIRDRLSPAPGPDANWKSILIEDEVLALSSGIYSQLVLTRQPVQAAKFWQVLAHSGMDVQTTFQAYKLSDDRSLFSRNGPFVHIFDTAADANLIAFLQKSFLAPYYRSSPILNSIEQVYNAVNEVYFPDSTFSQDEFYRTMNEYVSEPPPGLGHWIYYEAAWMYDNIAPDAPKQLWEVDSLGMRMQLHMTQVLDATAQLLSNLETPSPICQAEIQNSDNPDVQAYIGSKLSPGTLPGESGVKGHEVNLSGGNGQQGRVAAIQKAMGSNPLSNSASPLINDSPLMTVPTAPSKPSGVNQGESGVKGAEPVRACLILEQNE